MKKISWLDTKWALLALLALAFGFRFYFGLHCPSVIEDDDEVQIYLIGLKSYTTHTWPYFGTDMQGGGLQYTGQMPGALQGLLVALPLWILPTPESPYLFLNLFTFLALSFLAWYCCKRNPGLSPWFVFTWLYISPWTTHFSTAIINISYSLVGAVLFFIGFMESVPCFRLGLLSRRLANALVGFGFFWVYQLHMSWVMLGPFAAYSVYAQWKEGEWKTALGYATIGALPLLALLIPTYLVYGFNPWNNIHGYSSPFNWGNTRGFFTVLARLLSFGSFELPRFLGEHSHERLMFLIRSPWIMAPGFFLWALGILQALALLVLWFFPYPGKLDWKPVKNLALALFLIIYVFFWFSGKPPSAHRYYEALPVAMIYSFYCWEKLSAFRFWRIFGVISLIIGIFFQVGYAVKSDHDGISVYSQYGARMRKAIEVKDYRQLAERRAFAFY